MKRCVIVHGWDGYPKEGWFPWLKHELEAKGFAVKVPAMPHPETPTIDDWVHALAEAVGTPDDQLILVGHSMGCQTIWRYLQTLNEGEAVGGIVLVAPFVRLKPIIYLEPGVPEIFQEWLDHPLEWDRIRSHTKRSAAILSDNDTFVYKEDAPLFEKNLGARVIIMHKMSHFSGSDGLTELPEALEAVLSMS